MTNELRGYVREDLGTITEKGGMYITGSREGLVEVRRSGESTFSYSLTVTLSARV